MKPAAAPIGDGEIIRTAMREGWLEPGAAERALACGDATLALAELVSSGAIDRTRLSLLRQQLAFARQPELLGPYRIEEVLGHGGMGVVYRAVDPKGAEVAVKVLSPHLAADQVFQRRFLRESEVVSSIQSPYVVSCHGYGDEDGRLYMAMELMRGGDAQELCDRSGGFLPETSVLQMGRDIAEGLEVIHAHGLVHRDVKPENIFLGDQDRAKIGDFSIVHSKSFEDDKITAAGKAVGTPGFVSPEQARADFNIDGRADVYSLGASLYYLLTGRPPFVGTCANDVLSQTMIKSIPDPRLLRSDCSEGLSSIIRCAGSVHAKDRYPTVSLMREDIELVMKGKKPRNRPVSAMGTTEIVRKRDRRRTPAPVSGGLRILFVRGNPLAECAYERQLAAAGYHVLLASATIDGEQIQELKPDLIAVEMNEIDQKALNFLRSTRALSGFGATPIMVVSDIKANAERELMRDAGANVFVPAGGNLAKVIDDLFSNVQPTIQMNAAPAARESTQSLRERTLPALWQAAQLMERLRQGEISDRGILLEIADVLRPVAEPTDARTVAGALLMAVEGLARQLHGWMHHLNASSIMTLRQAFTVLEQVMAGPDRGSLDDKVALVVDDDLVSRKTMCQALKKVGLRAESVADAQQAFEALGRAQFSIVLSDVMMEGMNGIQFAQRIRGLENHRHIPVILVTGLTDFDKIFQARSDGADDAIAKPFLLMELATKALTHLVATRAGSRA